MTVNERVATISRWTSYGMIHGKPLYFRVLLNDPRLEYILRCWILRVDFIPCERERGCVGNFCLLVTFEFEWVMEYFHSAFSMYGVSMNI